MSPIWLVPIILVLLIEAATKGWLSFLLVPALIVIIPLLVTLMLISRRHLKTNSNARLYAAEIVTIVALLISYICTPGVGDTDADLLFGFYGSNIDSVATKISDTLCGIATVVGILGAIIWIVVLILAVRRSRHLKQSEQPQL